MWKYIVTWCIMSTAPTPCPDAARVDEFGRIQNSYFSCAVAHFKTVEDCDFSKTFTQRDSAYAFYNRSKSANKKLTWYEQDRVTNVKIDSFRLGFESGIKWAPSTIYIGQKER